MRVHGSQLIKRSPARDRTLDGKTFDSKAEMGRYAELKILLQAGKIWDLVLQPTVALIFYDKAGNAHKLGRGYLKLDFAYTTYRDGADRRVYEDAKGYNRKTGELVDTKMAALRRELAEKLNGIKVDVVTPASNY